MKWGSLAHAYILDRSKIAPSEFEARRGKEWTAFEADCDASGLIPVTLGDLAKLERIDAAVMGNEDARRIISSTDHEVTMAWDAGECGAMKARADMLNNTCLADLKLIKDCTPDKIMAALYTGLVDAQLGTYYIGAHEFLGLAPHLFYVVAVESAPPHCVTVVQFQAESVIKAGHEWGLGLAKAYRLHEAVGHFPGPSRGIIQFEKPRWAQSDNVDLTDAGGDM